MRVTSSDAGGWLVRTAKSPRTESGKARAVLLDLVKQHPEVFANSSRGNFGLTTLLYEAVGTAHEETVRALIDIIDGPRRQRFEEAVQRCLDSFTKPTGERVHDQLGREHAYTLDGDEARWRREYLTARGWTFPGGTRMVPPPHLAAKFKRRKP